MAGKSARRRVRAERTQQKEKNPASENHSSVQSFIDPSRLFLEQTSLQRWVGFEVETDARFERPGYEFHPPAPEEPSAGTIQRPSSVTAELTRFVLLIRLLDPGVPPLLLNAANVLRFEGVLNTGCSERVLEGRVPLCRGECSKTLRSFPLCLFWWVERGGVYRWAEPTNTNR